MNTKFKVGQVCICKHKYAFRPNQHGITDKIPIGNEDEYEMELIQ